MLRICSHKAAIARLRQTSLPGFRQQMALQGTMHGVPIVFDKPVHDLQGCTFGHTIFFVGSVHLFCMRKGVGRGMHIPDGL